MPGENNQYAIAVANSFGTFGNAEGPDSYPDIALTGFPDEETAVRVMNQWITETVDKHNADPQNQTGQTRWYAEPAVISEECSLTRGYIFAIEGGERENQVEFYIVRTHSYTKDNPLPNAEEHLAI